jgi:hypothetical protein
MLLNISETVPSKATEQTTYDLTKWILQNLLQPEKKKLKVHRV